MSLSYEKVSLMPIVFRNLTGVTVREFKDVVARVAPEWKKLEDKKQCEGRPSHLASLHDKVLCVLVYYRTYMSHTFLGYLFNLHNSNICRLLSKLEPLIARKITIKKDRSLTYEKVLKILADVTEQPTQRPKSKQRAHYSGKKKRHTIKAELVMEESGRIISISRSNGGRTHDFKIRKQEKPLPNNTIKYVDSGYQGLQKMQSSVVLPFKRKRKANPLTYEQRSHNRKLASFRIKVEHKIREIKIFKIMAEKYRNFQQKHNMRFNIIAGLVNLKHGF